jgi:hypothetical protein
MALAGHSWSCEHGCGDAADQENCDEGQSGTCTDDRSFVANAVEAPLPPLRLLESVNSLRFRLFSLLHEGVSCVSRRPARGCDSERAIFIRHRSPNFTILREAPFSSGALCKWGRLLF